MLIIVFGEMGMGKNFVGEMIAKEFDFHFLDGDNAIPLGKKSLLHKKDVDHFVKANLIPAIDKALHTYKNVVVAQALYFEEHRNQIDQYFKYLTTVKFVNIVAADVLQKERLLTRTEGKDFWLPYAARSHRHFQSPKLTDTRYAIIENNKGQSDIIEQIKALSFYSKPTACDEEAIREYKYC